MTDYKMAEVVEAPYFYTERTCTVDSGDINLNMEIAFRTLGKLVRKKGSSA